MKVNVTIIG